MERAGEGAGPDYESLVVAMTIVPKLYSRNKMFAFFKAPRVKEARARAAELRGVIRELAGANGKAEVDALPRGAERVLRYRIPEVRYHRVVQLSPLEASCVIYLAERAGLGLAEATAEDRAALHGALLRLGISPLRLEDASGGTVPVP